MVHKAETDAPQNTLCFASGRFTEYIVFCFRLVHKAEAGTPQNTLFCFRPVHKAETDTSQNTLFCFRLVHKAEADTPQNTLCFASGQFTKLKQTHMTLTTASFFQS